MIGGVSMTEEASSSSKIILDCIQCYDPLKDRCVTHGGFDLHWPVFYAMG